MSDILSRVERDLVIKWLDENKPQLTVQGIDLKIHESSYLIQKETIVLNSVYRSIFNEFETLPEIKIQFYYNKRLLGFDSKISKEQDSYCITIDKNVYKSSENSHEKLDCVSCRIYFSENGKTTQVDCNSNGAINVFDADDSALNIEKFFTGNFLSDVPVIQNRALKPVLLFLSDKELFIGCFDSFYNFSVDEKYSLEIKIPQPGLERTINCKGIVYDIKTFPEEKERFCYCFKLDEVKMEDERFLFEKGSSKKLT